MGEVYRARDPRLGRDVAIKILPASFSSDPERLRRFEQEARAAAALNHPNILAVYDIGQHDSAPYIVSELLEGETLRGRLTSGPIPVRKAVEFAVQIAHGLAAAHEKGIVHRDLKPENAFVTTDGRVKILDFGLAKLTQGELRGPAKAGHYVHGGSVRLQADLSALPTTPPDTLPGVVLGTVGYMAPEQVRGLTADHRSDIFAFGAILYEMLSGQRAFQGATMADTMTAILKEDPPDLPVADRHIPSALGRSVDRCLEKDPNARFQSTRDLAFALEALSSHSDASVASAPVRGLRERRVWRLASVVGLIAALAVGAVSALGVSYLWRAPAEARAVRFFVAAPESAGFHEAPTFLTLSPDGTRLVFVTRSGDRRLWVRSLDSLAAQPLPGTENGSDPFWSWDSRFVAFIANGKLKKVAVAGGPPQTLGDAAALRKGAWSRDEVILFSPTAAGPLYQVSATGGTPVPVTKLDQARQENAHLWPYFLPDGKRFLYFARAATAESSGIYQAELGSSGVRLVVRASSNVAYVSPGYLLFDRDGTLMAQRFNVDRAQTVGDAIPIAENVDYDPSQGAASFAVSETGVLAYRTGAGQPTSRLNWFDRSGKQLGTLGQPGMYRNPRLSPDGSRVAVEMVDSSRNRDIWVIDVTRQVSTRFTFDAAIETTPIWSPDGRRIAWRDAIRAYQKPSSGAGKEEPLPRTDIGNLVLDDWLPDGTGLLVHPGGITTRILLLSFAGNGAPRPVVESRGPVTHARVSPDGRWLAYISRESGRDDAYVQNFPTPTGKWEVSTSGGGQPKWRHDGKELFYIAPDGRLMAVPLTLTDRVEAGTPVALFQTRVEGAGAIMGGIYHQYDVTPNGQRFLVNTLEEQGESAPITVVLNWTAGLKN